MKRAVIAAAGLAAGLALGGCSHVRLPYLPGDRPFETSEAAGARADGRVDAVQTPRPVSANGRPPCKFGGERCPPWERAWPADHGIRPADRVSDAGVVSPSPGPSR